MNHKQPTILAVAHMQDGTFRCILDGGVVNVTAQQFLGCVNSVTVPFKTGTVTIPLDRLTAACNRMRLPTKRINASTANERVSQAIDLHRKGMSLLKAASTVGVAYSSCINWVRRNAPKPELTKATTIAKFTDEEVHTLRERYRVLAALPNRTERVNLINSVVMDRGCGYSSVIKMLTGETYRHVPMEPMPRFTSSGKLIVGKR